MSTLAFFFLCANAPNLDPYLHRKHCASLKGSLHPNCNWYESFIAKLHEHLQWKRCMKDCLPQMVSPHQNAAQKHLLYFEISSLSWHSDIFIRIFNTNRCGYYTRKLPNVKFFVCERTVDEKSGKQISTITYQINSPGLTGLA